MKEESACPEDVYFNELTKTIVDDPAVLDRYPVGSTKHQLLTILARDWIFRTVDELVRLVVAGEHNPQTTCGVIRSLFDLDKVTFTPDHRPWLDWCTKHDLKSTISMVLTIQMTLVPQEKKERRRRGS